jgi:hypothetical protein
MADQRADSFFLPWRYHINFMHSEQAQIKKRPSHHFKTSTVTHEVRLRKTLVNGLVGERSVGIVSRIDCGSIHSSGHLIRLEDPSASQ